jgi:hypothetical protein
LVESVGGVQVLEVLHQIRAVELAVAEVAGERGEPGSAEQAARVAHRVRALDARPIGQGRADDRDDAGMLGRCRGHHHDRPTGLAVADHHGLAVGAGVQLAHLLEELRLRVGDVLDGLAGLGVREEGHEIDRVAGPHGDADLALLLEAADAGAVPGARIHHHERPLLRVDGLACLGVDPDERVVDRSLELAPVHDHLVVERQHRRLAGPVVLDRLIAALAQHVPEQDGALAGVDPVIPGLLGEAGCRRRRFGHLAQGFGPGCRYLLRHPLRDGLCEPGKRRGGRRGGGRGRGRCWASARSAIPGAGDGVRSTVPGGRHGVLRVRDFPGLASAGKPGRALLHCSIWALFPRHAMRPNATTKPLQVHREPTISLFEIVGPAYAFAQGPNGTFERSLRQPSGMW